MTANCARSKTSFVPTPRGVRATTSKTRRISAPSRTQPAQQPMRALPAPRTHEFGLRDAGSKANSSDAPRINVNQLYRVAFATLRRGLGAEANLIEDLVQESLTRALQGLGDGSFQGRSELVTWVGTIARHVALDSIRSRRRERLSAPNIQPDTLSAPFPIDLEAQLEARSTLAVVARLLNEMAPTTADIIFLHDVCGVELTDIAQRKHMTVSAVQSRLVRGRRVLASRLQEVP